MKAQRALKKSTKRGKRGSPRARRQYAARRAQLALRDMLRQNAEDMPRLMEQAAKTAPQEPAEDTENTVS